jgi:hypothetical protein
MKQYLINLFFVCISLLTIIFFITWDMNVSQWGETSRMLFALGSLFLAFIVSLIQDEL